jgi:glycosyltransferase involved in cell wall biosynthesis
MSDASAMRAADSPAVAPLLRVAYLVNQYPKVSHSFIRREILALERAGVAVERFAVRGWEGDTPDPADAQERVVTRYLLADGVAALLPAVWRTLVSAPGAFFRSLGLAWKLGRRADRPRPYHLVYFAQACRLREWLRDGAAVHLHAHFGTNSAEVAQLTHALGGPPYSFTVHGPDEFDKPEALHLADKVRDAAFVVAVSSYGRSQLFRWIGAADWPRVEVVHCGLDAAFLAAVTTEPADVPRLVCVGRLSAQKGPLLLVNAVARLRQQGVAVELVLAGDGEMRQEVEALISSHALRAHVRITGWISAAQVAEELTAARALVLPSFAEGLPVVLMEAMALRRPVITTFVAGIPELVRDGEEGWLFPAGDIDALCGAMTACLQTSVGELARRGRAARSRVLARHDIDVEAQKLLRLFRRGCETRTEPA